MKNKTTPFILALMYFACSEAHIHRLNYTLPHEPENWIEDVFMLENVILVVHQTGISVSNNHGLSFNEAKIDTELRREHKFNNNTGFISNNKSVFLVSLGSFHVISNNAGVSFNKISQSPGHGFQRVLQDQTNLYCLTSQYFSDLLHNKNYFISGNNGETWREVPVGSNDSENVFKIFMDNNILYVLTSDLWPPDDVAYKLYRSNDHGASYERISYDPEDDLFKQSKEEARLFLQRWNNLDIDMPPLAIEEGAGNYRFRYTNPDFDRITPARGIFYERPSGQSISVNLAPRKGGFISAAKEKIYFSSFKEIWVEN